MFLVEKNAGGLIHLVFTSRDPRLDGYVGPVTEGVTLGPDPPGEWPPGEPLPIEVAGQDPADPKHYRAFKDADALKAAGFRPVDGQAVRHNSWVDYLRKGGG